ncbi:HET-domain-containing protein [Alternaria alternata]|uniref:HET-domain-containing protein n=1 Tax=Alternaria alternata TaxID=5599 RepID=A0A177DWH4_ALTAL|nr:HET-domain-containing protein [Alternaria alternata]OAG23540.1 HET-domain-containing protein [Alternaria alternata]
MPLHTVPGAAAGHPTMGNSRPVPSIREVNRGSRDGRHLDEEAHAEAVPSPQRMTPHAPIFGPTNGPAYPTFSKPTAFGMSNASAAPWRSSLIGRVARDVLQFIDFSPLLVCAPRQCNAARLANDRECSSRTTCIYAVETIKSVFMAWHDATCATLDLEWEDGQPGCRKCERKAPKLAPVHPISPPAPPPDTPRSELICTWPPSLFSQAQGGDDEDSDTLARILANIDEWTGTTSTRSSQRELKSDQQTPQQQPLDRSEPDLLFQGVYSRLPDANSIRLLRLRGSEDTSHPVCGTLENHRLHDPCRPIFEAFSYTWADSQGNSSLCKTIFLGPQYDVLPVTTNCLAALRRFRTVADRLVWVDAICINQFDLEERGHQVSLMRDIYTSAARVLTYLGDKHDLLDTVAERSDSDGQRFDPLHVDLKAIVRMPYFSRIWVVQELLLSKTASLTFDDHTMHWTDFSSHVKSLTASREDGFYGNWVGLLSKRRRIKDLMSALQITQDCRCSDPRDRVYGLMGLVDDEDRNNFPIDYELSVQQLYTGLTMYWLTKPGRCDHSSGLSWFSSPFANERDDLRHGWSLDDNFWNHVCSREPQRSDRSAFEPRYSWGKLAIDAGWNPDSPARLLSANGILALDAVHILSIREGKVEIIDTDGKSLQGLYVAGSDHSNSGDTYASGRNRLTYRSELAASVFTQTLSGWCL